MPLLKGRSVSESALENGWRRHRFDEMAVLVNDRVDDPAEADVDYYVGLEHLDSDSLAIRRWGTPADVEATKLRFRSGDIIFGRRRVYQRKLGVAQFDGICSAHAMVLRAKPAAVLQELLPFFMQSDLFMERAKEISVGSLSPTINWKTLAKEEFVLPPPEDQREIAALLMGAESLLQATSELASSLETLRRSLLVHLFARLLGDSSVRKQRLGDAGGVLMGRQRSPKYEAGPSLRRYLRVANVLDGHIDTTDVKSMQFSDKEFEQYRLLDGDILLNEGQSRELVGRSSIFRGELPDVCFQNTLIRFRPSKSLSSEFSQRYFQYCLYGGRFIANSKQTTSIAHLGVQRFAQMSIPVPDEDVQLGITRRIAEVEERLEDARTRERALRALKTCAVNETLVRD